MSRLILGGRVFLLGVALALGATAASAAYPEHAVTFVVPSAPTGGTDFLIRLIAPALSQKWGQPAVVLNKPGASTTLGSSYVARSAPDGYTFLMAGSTLTIPIEMKLDYDPVKSFTPVTEMVSSPAIFVVNPALHVNSLADFVALAKSKPGQLNYAGADAGGGGHDLAIRTFSKGVGISMVAVPYNAAPLEVTAVLGNEVQLAAGGVEIASLVQSGKLIALATTSDVRLGKLPDVPTVAEAAHLPGYNIVTWFGILAPAGTPPTVVNKVHDDIVAIMKTPEISQKLIQQGYIMVGNTPAEFTKTIAASVASWADFQHQ